MKEIRCGVCENEDILVVESSGIIVYRCNLCYHIWGKHDCREK